MAKLYGDRCDLIPVKGDFQPRMQVYAIKEVLKLRGYDALAISVTDSEMLAKALEGISIPVVTFDSDFADNFQWLRRNYVGVDNYEVGVQLGLQAKLLKPEGGTICFMSALYNENISRRMDGVRDTLIGAQRGERVTRLSGIGNWEESNRCPWNTGDDPIRALHQLGITLSRIKPDLIISVGDWAIREPVRYRELVIRHSQLLENGDVSILSANGVNSAKHEQLLKDGLLQSVVNIDFESMGEEVYKTTQQLSDIRTVE